MQTHTKMLVHARTHTLVALPLSESITLVTYFALVSTGICVWDVSLSLFPLPLWARRVSLDHSGCVSQSLTCTLSVLLYITGTPSQKHTLPFPFLPQVPNREPAPTYLLTSYHWVDTADFNRTVTHSPASFMLFFIFWRWPCVSFIYPCQASFAKLHTYFRRISSHYLLCSSTANQLVLEQNCLRFPTETKKKTKCVTSKKEFTLFESCRKKYSIKSQLQCQPL